MNKKYLKLGIGTIIFIVIGLAAFFLAAYLCKWDIWSWFGTQQAFLVYAIIGVVVLVGGFLLWRLKLNDRY